MIGPQAQITQPGFPPAGADVEDVREAWRDACTDAQLAYLDWRDAGSDHARMAYAVYVAAADREAVAADTLEQWARGRATADRP